MNISSANRVKQLPPYLFAELEKLKEKKINNGEEVLDLSVGDPNFPTNSSIINTTKEALDNPINHRYPPFKGTEDLKRSVTKWYRERFGVKVDPDKEVLILLGSKEGISHLSLAYLNPGDIALVPNPGYPAYSGGVALAEGQTINLPLREENKFFPDFNEISVSDAKNAKLMFLNYPNNPTGATASLEQFNKAVEFARKNNILIAHDAAYSEITFNEHLAPSFLQADHAKEVGVEFHSFSKTFCMTGWRIGMVVGNEHVINNLSKAKAFIDSGVFSSVQKGASYALENYKGVSESIKNQYKERIEIIKNGLEKEGWEIEKPNAGYFIWAKIPGNQTSMEFCIELLNSTGVLITPGIGFGEYGEGYVRISLNVEKSLLKKAIPKISTSHNESEETYGSW